MSDLLVVIEPSGREHDILELNAPPSKTMYYRLAGLLLSGRGCIRDIPDCEDADAVNDILLAAGAVLVSDNRICLDYFREARTYEVDVRCSGGALRVTMPAFLAATPIGSTVKIRMCRRLLERLEEGTWQLLGQLGEWTVREEDSGVVLEFVHTRMPEQIIVQSMKSSQPASGAILAAVVISSLLDKPVRFDVIVGVSLGHIYETLEVVKKMVDRLEYSVEESGATRITGEIVASQHRYVLRVPGDWSLASLLLPLATRYTLIVDGLWSPWPGPGDHMAAHYALTLGYTSMIEPSKNDSFRWIMGPGRATTTDLLLRDEPDLAVSMLFAAAAIGSSARIRGISHLALKESNRLESVAHALRMLGLNSYHAVDSIIVSGSCGPRLVEYVCPGDHRLAMGIATLGLACRAHIKILKADCVSKSWRSFWEVIRGLGVANIEVGRGD